MSFLLILLLILVGYCIIGVPIIWFVLWKKRGLKVFAEKIKTTPYFDLTKPKELRPSKKAVLLFLISDCPVLFFIILGIWEGILEKKEIIHPAIFFLLGILMILIYSNVKYLSTRIIISSTGISRIDIFRKTHITWLEIKKLQFFSIFLYSCFPHALPAMPFFLFYVSRCFLYGQKNKILIPFGIRERNILIKTIIQKADLKSAQTSDYPSYVGWAYVEWVK